MPKDSWATSESDKANIFAEHLAKIFKPYNIILNITQTLNITRYLEFPLLLALPTNHTNQNEIQYLWLEHPTKKAPSHDLISNLIIKHLLDKSIILLALIFNSVFRLSYFPIVWMHSNIILIPKPDKLPDISFSIHQILSSPPSLKLLKIYSSKDYYHFRIIQYHSKPPI